MHIITRMIRGGAQKIVLNLLRDHDRSAFAPILVAGEQTGPEGTLWDEVEALDIETVRVPPLVREVAPLSDLKAFSSLRSVIRRIRPVIVHAHTSKAGFIGCLAARMEKVPGIILAPHGHILGEDARIPGVPERGLKRRLLAVAARENSRYADVIVAPNEAERADGIALSLWDEDNSVVIPNGVDTGKFCAGDRTESKKKLGFRENDTLVGVAARLTREKGLDYAIRTIGELPAAHLVIVGSGPEQEPLEQMARLLGVAPRVHFLGLKTSMEKIFPAFDVCLVPSRSESHGMAAAEAACCEVPVVASNIGGLRRVIKHGETGLLVPPGDIDGYKKAIQKLLFDPPRARRLASAGRKHMIRSFSTEIMQDKITALYYSLLKAATRKIRIAPPPRLVEEVH